MAVPRSIPYIARPSWSSPDAPAPAPAPDASGALLVRPGTPGAANRAGTTGSTRRGEAVDAADAARAAQPAEPIDLGALGPLAPHAEGATDLFVNGERGLWVDRGRGAEREPSWEADERMVRALAVALIARGGRHVDEATPAVDARIGGGIRVHAVLPPVATAGTLISVRVPRQGAPSLADLVRGGLCDERVAQRLRAAVAARENLLVTGAAGAGKTTLLGALLAEAPAAERIVLIEDVAELRVRHPHVVALQARQANLEGAGGLGLDALLREALRMRPDRIVVGECRGAELRELLSALNTGHDGGAGTLHANALDEVPARLEALGAAAGMTPDAVARQAASAFDLVVHVERDGTGRRISGTGRLRLDGGRLVVLPSEAEAGA
ncbi:TadA family conjugal transfer-associated ATPase [Agromyces rhizosphaerae]|nr:TadA family conjugal transfer-associated ATPase [Agromyces rhizosphaerae]